MESHVVQTIVNARYLPLAETLMRSVAENLPQARRRIVMLDDFGLRLTPSAEIVNLGDLGFSDAEILDRRKRYDVVELATSVKARALMNGLTIGKSSLYLDPDTYVYGDLLGAVEVHGHDVVSVTPHRLFPVPLDGRIPDETTFKRYGVFNLGFLAVNGNAESLLKWWDERLVLQARNAPAATLFTDQRWFDLVPGYFPCRVIRHPGINVAHWNLDERILSRNGNRLEVNGEAPLLLAHFSGIRQMPRSGAALPELHDTRHRAADHVESASLFESAGCDWWAQVVQSAALLRATSSNLPTMVGEHSGAPDRTLSAAYSRVRRVIRSSATRDALAYALPSDGRRIKTFLESKKMR